MPDLQTREEGNLFVFAHFGFLAGVHSAPADLATLGQLVR